MPPQTQAGRVRLPRRHPGQRGGHRRPVAAADAHDLVHGAVDLQHQRRGGAGRLVQAVDVLGDQRAQPALPLQVDQRGVPGVGLRVGVLQRRRMQPGPAPDLGVGEVVAERHELLGVRVAGPHAVRPPVVGDAAVGGDARAGQDADPRAAVGQPVGDGAGHPLTVGTATGRRSAADEPGPGRPQAGPRRRRRRRRTRRRAACRST